MQKRKDESTKLPKAIEGLGDVLNQTSSMMSVVKDQVEKAAEAAASTASSVAEQASSSANASPSAKDELDDEPEKASTASSELPQPSAFDWSQYTQADLDSLASTYEKVKQWLEESTVAQSELSASDDPALLSTDLNDQAEQLNNMLVSLLQKRAYKPPKPKSSSRAKASKSKKSKTSSTPLSPSETSGSSSTETVLSVSIPSNEPVESRDARHEEL